MAIFQNLIKLSAALVSVIFCSENSLAAVQISLGGSHSESNAGYQKIESGAGSAGVSIDLGSYTRLGYTHRQELSQTTGYELKEATNQYVYFRSRSHIIANAVDLTLILYAGDIVTPFVFGGISVKNYNTEMVQADGTREKLHLTLPGPQGGAGLSIRLNQKFSLKLTYTVSDGVKQIPGSEGERTIDSYSQVGISYTL